LGGIDDETKNNIKINVKTLDATLRLKTKLPF